MNKLKILVPDNLVMVDGITLQMDLTDLIASDIWAVSFEDGKGEIEFTDPDSANQTINHLADYQTIVDAHATILAQENELASEAAQLAAAQAADLKVKMDGFDYKGQMISFSQPDRRAVAEANQAFEKKDPSGSYYVPDTTALTIKFENGSTLALTRSEFDTEFFPQFFQRASADFM